MTTVSDFPRKRTAKLQGRKALAGRRKTELASYTQERPWHAEGRQSWHLTRKKGLGTQKGDRAGILRLQCSVLRCAELNSAAVSRHNHVSWQRAHTWTETSLPPHLLAGNVTTVKPTKECCNLTQRLAVVKLHRATSLVQ